MTQTPRPQEAKDNFSQVANVLIQGYPDLDLQSRYVPIALTSICWEEKYYPLSLRQIASLAHVDHTALRSRNGAKPREGILDRLKRVGILDYKDEKPVDPTTGKEGRSQTYICIRYSNIWKENARFFADKKSIKVTPLTVDPVNSDNNVEVTTVDQNNHTVDPVNVTVDPVNHTVDNACSNAGHNTVIPEDKNTFTPARESENNQIGQLPSEEKKLTASSQIAYSHKPETSHVSLGSPANTVEVAREPGYKQRSTATIDSPSQAQEKQPEQSEVVEETPTMLIPPESKPEKKYNIPADLTIGLNERGNRPLTKTEQKALDNAEQRNEALRIKGRETELWAMAERIALVVPRTTYAKQSITAMAQTKMLLEDIEIVMKKFDEKSNFDLTAIANYLPKYAARKKNGQPDNITSFTEYRQKPQPEVRIFKSKTPLDVGSHLDPNDYDEEPYIASK